MVIKQKNEMKHRDDGVTEIYARIRGENKAILVDTEDVPKLFPHNNVRWYLDDCTPYNLPYAATEGLVPGKRKKMHRVIMDAKPGQWVEYLTNHTLDNRKKNLRIKNTRSMKKEDAHAKSTSPEELRERE